MAQESQLHVGLTGVTALLDKDTILADHMPLDVQLRINPEAVSAIAAHYGAKVSPNPVSSPQVGIPTLDQLRERAGQGVGGAEPGAMIGGLGRELGRENVQYRGFESAKFVGAWRSIDGAFTKVPLMFMRGRLGHDWGAKYFSKIYRHGDTSVPEVLWGQPKFLPRPPVSPPYSVTEIPEPCLFCSKAGFPSLTERRRHMEKKHKAEYGAVREAEERAERKQHDDAMLEVARGNSELIRAIMGGGVLPIPSNAQLRTVPEAAISPAQDDDDPAPEVSTLGKFWPIKEAANYYRLSRNAMQMKVTDGSITAVKKLGRWQVFVPSMTWEPPVRTQTRKQKQAS